MSNSNNKNTNGRSMTHMRSKSLKRVRSRGQARQNRSGSRCKSSSSSGYTSSNPTEPKTKKKINPTEVKTQKTFPSPLAGVSFNYVDFKATLQAMHYDDAQYCSLLRRAKMLMMRSKESDDVDNEAKKEVIQLKKQIQLRSKKIERKLLHNHSDFFIRYKKDGFPAINTLINKGHISAVSPTSGGSTTKRSLTADAAVRWYVESTGDIATIESIKLLQVQHANYQTTSKGLEKKVKNFKCNLETRNITLKACKLLINACVNIDLNELLNAYSAYYQGDDDHEEQKEDENDEMDDEEDHEKKTVPMWVEDVPEPMQIDKVQYQALRDTYNEPADLEDIGDLLSDVEYGASISIEPMNEQTNVN
eukprot:990615_1